MNTDEKFVGGEEGFWRALSDNEELWYAPAFEAFPSVVAHEYRRLREELAKGRPFAAMLQIKDVWEALLKLGVLTAYAWAGQAEIAQFREKVECIITTRSLSMGAWMELAREIIAFFKPGKASVPMPEVLYGPLDAVRKFYGRYELVNWRNESVGHGALVFSEDQEFRRDIREKLELMKRLFGKIGEHLTEQRMETDGGLTLMGADTARNLPEQEGKVFFGGGGQALRFELSPYMYIREGSVYFFDNQKTPSRTQRLSYTTGGRRSEEDGYFRMLDEIREQLGLQLDMDAASGYIVASEEKYLNRLGMESGFVEPKHLTGWAEQEIGRAEKGIFLLTMPRGTGKTTFTEKLNRLYEGPLELADDLDVRTYHLSRTQVRSRADFERGIETLWSLAYRQEPWTAYTRISDLRGEGMEPSEALAAYLRQVREFTDRRRGREHILMVIDGLDEIADAAVWEYIPRAEQLEEGVYILLTCRDPEQEPDLPASLGERLSGLDIQGRLSVRADSGENIDFLKKYANRDGAVQKNQIDRLLELSQNRVLYLGMYLALLRSGLKLKELPEAQKLCGRYVGELEKKYGEKKALRLRRILSVLSSAGRYEPLTLGEIAELSDEGGVTFELLGMMNDLRAVMKVSRGYGAAGRRFAGENRYELVNADIAAAMFTLLPEAKDMVKERLSALPKEIMDMSGDEKITDGALVTLSYATELLELAGVREEDWPAISEEAALKIDDKLRNRFEYHLLVLERLKRAYLRVMRLYRGGEGSYARGRLYWGNGVVFYYLQEMDAALEMHDGARRILEELDTAGLLTDRNELAAVYNDLGNAYQNRPGIPEALEQYEKARAIREEMDAAGLLTDRNELAVVYNDAAGAFRALDNHPEALKLYEKARAISEELFTSGQSEDRSFLAMVYNNMAMVLQFLGRISEALELYEKALAISTELDTKGKLEDRGFLATVYINMALVYSFKIMPSEALNMIGKARMILEELDAEGRLLKWNNLAVVYDSMGLALGSQSRFREGMELFGKALAIREELDAAGRLTNRYDLATLYNNMALALQGLKMHSEALELYEKACAIGDQLDEKERSLNRSDFANVYFNMAIALEQLKRLPEALELYRKAGAIREELDAEGALEDRNDLAEAYCGTAMIFAYREENSEALELFEKARTIREELDASGLLKDRNSLAAVYNNIGNVLKSADRLHEALELFEKARTIREGLDASGLLKDRNSLAAVYCNMADAFDLQGKLPEALELYERARTIREELDASGLLEDRSDLTCVYEHMAHVFAAQGRFSEDLEMLGKARVILEELDAKGLLEDRNELAKVYNNMLPPLYFLQRADEALETADKARVICEELDKAGQLPDRNNLAKIYVNIAVQLAGQLADQEKTTEAMKMCGKALTVCGELDAAGLLSDRNLLANACSLSAYVLEAQQMLSDALDMYEKALRELRVLDRNGRKADYDLMHEVQYRIALIWQKKNQPPKALEYCEKACSTLEWLDARRKLKDRNELAVAYNKMAELLLLLNRRADALEYLNKARGL